MNPTDNAQRAVVHLQAGLELPPDVRQWLLEGLSSYLHAGEPLERALALQPRPGQLRPSTVMRLAERNKTLRAIGYWAASGLPPGPAARRVIELVWKHKRGERIDLPAGHPAFYLLSKLEGEDIPGIKQLSRILSE